MSDPMTGPYLLLHRDNNVLVACVTARVTSSKAVAASMKRRELRELMLEVAAGQETASEAMGHRELILTHNSFEPRGPACLPRTA